MPKTILEMTEKDGMTLTAEYAEMEVEFYQVEGPKHTIEAKITTPNTVLFSYGNRDRKVAEQCDNIVNLFGNPEAMKNVATGATVNKDKATERFNERTVRFLKQANPFSAFTIENVKEEFVGHVIAGGAGTHPITQKPLIGRSELAIVITPKQQNKGHGTDALTALTYAWAPYLKARNFKVNGDQDLVALWATAGPTNGTSRILENAGYDKLSTFDHPDYKSPRNEYEIGIDKIFDIVKSTRNKYKF